MKTFNKTIKSNDIQVEVIVEDNGSELKEAMNTWFKENSVEIISIDYTVGSSWIRCHILYKV